MEKQWETHGENDVLKTERDGGEAGAENDFETVRTGNHPHDCLCGFVLSEAMDAVVVSQKFDDVVSYQQPEIGSDYCQEQTVGYPEQITTRHHKNYVTDTDRQRNYDVQETNRYRDDGAVLVFEPKQHGTNVGFTENQNQCDYEERTDDGEETP